MAASGAILAAGGCTTGYKLRAASPNGGAWSGPIFILTHWPVDDPAYTFLYDDVPSAVATALKAAGGKNLVLFGASIARQCLQQGLVDEIVIHLAPILLGDDVRLFDVPGGERIHLQRIYCEESGQLTDLRFRPTRAGGALITPHSRNANLHDDRLSSAWAQSKANAVRERLTNGVYQASIPSDRRI